MDKRHDTSLILPSKNLIAHLIDEKDSKDSSGEIGLNRSHILT